MVTVLVLENSFYMRDKASETKSSFLLMLQQQQSFHVVRWNLLATAEHYYFINILMISFE